MFIYNVKLAVKSLNDRIGLTILMVLAIATGLGLLMTMNTLAHQSSKIPVPHISQTLYAVQLDNRELSADDIVNQSEMINLTYQDAINLYEKDTPASLQTYAWNTGGILNVESANVNPFRASIGATTHRFFEMVDTPFLYGTAWNADADDTGLASIVLSKKTNDRLFNGDNSVGKFVRIGVNELVVTGVLDEWYLPARFYDQTFYSAFPDDAFIPSTFAFQENFPRQTNFACWSEEANPGRFGSNDLQELKVSECAWMAFWAKLESPDQVSQYADMLNQYVIEQKQLGRFPREINNFLTNINEQMKTFDFSDGWIGMMQAVGGLFFAVCLINAVTILLAKFMRRVKEVSLRRALGAKRKTLMQQYLIEVSLIGFIGGVLGIFITYLGLEAMLAIQLYSVDYMVPESELRHYYQLDWIMIGWSFLVALGSALVVGLYPIWRVVSIAPATQLKAQ